MNMYEIIDKKKRGGVLSREEIFYFADGYGKGEIPDYQVSALTMAICLRGMNYEETLALTEAIYKSGKTLDLSVLGNLSCDKHSTGGVGDKTTLILAPIAAAAGCRIAKMSGRGLGHTGGTIDKLESVPGFSTSVPSSDFLKHASEVGVSVIGQTEELAPLDKKLYALRDVTATVDSIPLIASSVMGKKLASGAKNIVLDVKCGTGSFMKDEKSARELAGTMVDLGVGMGRRVTALITDMDSPLGYAVGNNLEVKEAIGILSGRGDDRLRELCLTLASELVAMSQGKSRKEAKEICRGVLESGAALKKFRQWITSAGGDGRYIDDPSLFPVSGRIIEVKAKTSGYIGAVNAEKIGLLSVRLGAGRAKKSDHIDPAAGIVMQKRYGDRVEKDEVIARLYTDKGDREDSLTEEYLSALVFTDSAPCVKPVVLCRITDSRQ